MARLMLGDVAKTYRGGIVAAHDLELTVESGEFFVIVGPSGSGKSTLLRLIAGLEPLDDGFIVLGDRRIDGLAPRDRDLAMVFQDLVVYPHLTVFENIAFGLRARRVPRREVEPLVAHIAGVFGLEAVLDRSPTTLSGGQKRRVTLARALVLRPSLYLFDEPFAGLDAPLRAAIRGELAELHRQMEATMILVTHDQGEALALADRIAVVDAGRIVQVGRPSDLYDAPCNRFVAGFIGQPPMAQIPCFVKPRDADSIAIALQGVHNSEWVVDRAGPVGRLLAHRSSPVVGFRAEAVAVVATPEEQAALGPNWLAARGKLVRLEPAGHETLATFNLGDHLVAARLPARTSLPVGELVTVAIDLDQACWFDSATGDRLVAAT